MQVLYSPVSVPPRRKREREKNRRTTFVSVLQFLLLLFILLLSFGLSSPRVLTERASVPERTSRRERNAWRFREGSFVNGGLQIASLYGSIFVGSAVPVGIDSKKGSSFYFVRLTSPPRDILRWNTQTDIVVPFSSIDCPSPICARVFSREFDRRCYDGNTEKCRSRHL